MELCSNLHCMHSFFQGFGHVHLMATSEVAKLIVNLIFIVIYKNYLIDANVFGIVLSRDWFKTLEII